VLLLGGLLAVALGAFAYDHFVAAPGSEQAHAKVQLLIDQHLARPAATGQPLHSADVRRAIGFAPTYTQVEQGYTIEWYCWWGWTPGLNQWKRYVTVVYVGQEPRRLRSHFLNQAPTEESLPKDYLPSEIAEPLPVPGPLGLPGPGSTPSDKDKPAPGPPNESEKGNNPPQTDKLKPAAEEPISEAP
jgi:hypothetical protein